MKAPKVGQHKYNPGLWRQERVEPVISDRYQAEIDASLRKAQRAWKAAEKAATRVEKQVAKDPSPPNIARRDELRLLVLARLDELRRIEALMQPVRTTPRDAVRIVNKGWTL